MRLGVAGLLAGAVLAVPTAAAGSWADQARVTGELGADVVPSPSLSCIPLSVGVSFEWTEVPGASSYTFYLDQDGPGEEVEGTSKYVLSLVGGGTAVVVANRSYGATTWSSVRSNGVAWGSLVVSGCT